LTAPPKFCYSSFAAPLADLGLQGGVVTTVNMMMHEELEADQISVGAFFGRLRDQYRLVPSW